MAINLLVLVLQAHAKDSVDEFVDDLANTLFNRALKALPLQHDGLDGTVLGKPGHMALTPRGTASSALPHPQPWSARGDFQVQHRNPVVHAASQLGDKDHSGVSEPLANMNRRNMLAGLASAGGSALLPKEAQAVQGYTAGRIPGTQPSEIPGFLRYTRPEGKQGGHGVGWSEIPPYTFLLPEGWEETAVSIADLGGTELDARFKSKTTNAPGDMAIIVAPVLRFTNVGFGADVRITELGSPEKMLLGFGPEITGGPIDEDMIEKVSTRTDKDIPYYDYVIQGPGSGKLKFDKLMVSMSAYKNRVYILSVRPYGPERIEEFGKDYQMIADSFRIGGTYNEA